MSRLDALLPLLLLPFGFAACATAPEDSGIYALPPAPEPYPDEDEPVDAEATRLTVSELAVWNHPEFKQRFAESYIAETEVEPRVTLTEADRMREVYDLIAANRMSEALVLLQESRSPTASAVFDFAIGNIHYQAERFDLALASYREATGKYSKFRRAWGMLGQTHVRHQDFESALPALTRVVELGGGDAYTFGLLGIAHSNQRNYVSAESAYRMAVLLDPATKDWQMGLAYSFFQQQRYAEAVALFEVLLLERPDSAELWNLKANAHVGMGQQMKAAESFEVAARLGGATAQTYGTLGDIYVNQELYDLAAESYAQAMEADAGGGVDRALQAAGVLARRGAAREARPLVERIEALHGETLGDEKRRELLRLRVRLAEFEAATEEEVAVLKEIVKLDPQDGAALIRLGLHSRLAGELERAAFYYERAASLEEFEADARLRHAELLVGEGRYDEALPLLERAQAIEHRDFVAEYLKRVERAAARGG